MLEKRCAALLCLFLLAMSVLAARIFYIGLGALPESVTALGGQHTRTLALAQRRGIIYDRRGESLARDAALWLCVVDHAGFDYDAHGESLCRAAGIGSGALLLLRERGIPYALRAAERVDLPGVYSVPDYRTGESGLAPHVVGYLDADGAGVCGLEKSYDLALRYYGGSLSLLYRANALGVQLGNSLTVVDNAGYDAPGGIVCTLDAGFQRGLEALSIAKGAAVVCDSETGEILASASYPSYTSAAAVLDSPDGNLLNRAALTYTPGSVFKLVTAAAALEHGFDPSETLTCTGERCYGGIPHGEVDMKRAMAQSCNAYFAYAARTVGGDAVREMGERLGIGQEGSIDGIPCGRGAMETRSEANLAIGQGGTLLSPYTLASAVGTIVSGGIRTPLSLVRGLLDGGGELHAVERSGVRVLSEELCDTLREMMEEVIASGTGQDAFCVCGAPLGGKTATAQTGQRDADGTERLNRWFAGYAGRYTIVVLREDDGSAAASFAEIVSFLKKSGNLL